MSICAKMTVKCTSAIVHFAKLICIYNIPLDSKNMSGDHRCIWLLKCGETASYDMIIIRDHDITNKTFSSSVSGYVKCEVGGGRWAIYHRSCVGGWALVLDLTLLQMPYGFQMKQHIEIAHPAGAGIEGVLQI
jgi:hypothetical protein